MKHITRNVNQILEKISSAIYRRKSFLFLFCSALVISFSIGCNDEEDIGLVLLPPGDNVSTGFSDSATIRTVTMHEDTLRSDELSIQMLGKFNDPVFGISTASVYTQAYLTGTPAFGAATSCDSLVLSLGYSGYYGDTLTFEQKVNVYELLQDIYIDSNYYSSRTFTTDAVSLGSYQFFPKPNTSVQIIDTNSDTLTLGPQIRISLDTALGNRIISKNGGTELSSNAEWLKYFKGLYLDMSTTSPMTNQGAISYFNFFDTDSKLILYYHDSGLPRTYQFSLTGARVNTFTHDYLSLPINQYITTPSDADTVAFVQSMSGLKTKITFPYLKHFLDSGSIAVNKAELTITSETVTVPYNLPEKMLLVTTDDNGATIYPIDYYDISGYYGGDLNLTGNGYTFNVARQIQRYLDGTINNADFYLIVSGSGVEANRAVVKSHAAKIDQMKFSLFYTKLN